MLLFRDEEHIDRWCTQWNQLRGATLTIDQAWELARAGVERASMKPRICSRGLALQGLSGACAPRLGKELGSTAIATHSDYPPVTPECLQIHVGGSPATRHGQTDPRPAARNRGRLGSVNRFPDWPAVRLDGLGLIRPSRAPARCFPKCAPLERGTVGE